MNTYTMTFVNNEGLSLPANKTLAKPLAGKAILREMLEHNYALADFNWSGCYNPDNTKSYLTHPYNFKSVVEIRLQMDIHEISNREGIYQYCVQALQKGRVSLIKLEQFPESRQSIVCFST